MHTEHGSPEDSRWCRVEHLHGNFYIVLLIVLVRYWFSRYASDLKFFFK